MVDPRDRVERMVAEGLLDDVQAEKLRDGLASSPMPERRRGWGSRQHVVLLLAVGTALVAALVWLNAGGGGPEEIQDVAQTVNQPGEHGEMNRSISTMLAVALFLIIPIAIWVWLHNSLVSREESVFESWAQTESNFQRRADLIPSLVETVNRYLQHERETMTDVTSARGQAMGKMSDAINRLIDEQKAAVDLMTERGTSVLEDDEAMRQLFDAQARMGSNISQVMAVVEAYPELRSSDQFLELQGQLEGTENRINVARLRFNEAVGEFNTTMRMLPWNLVASLGRFKRKAYFRADEGSDRAPELQFK